MDTNDSSKAFANGFREGADGYAYLSRHADSSVRVAYAKMVARFKRPILSSVAVVIALLLVLTLRASWSAGLIGVLLAVASCYATYQWMSSGFAILTMTRQQRSADDDASHGGPHEHICLPVTLGDLDKARQTEICDALEREAVAMVARAKEST